MNLILIFENMQQFSSSSRSGQLSLQVLRGRSSTQQEMWRTLSRRLTMMEMENSPSKRCSEGMSLLRKRLLKVLWLLIILKQYPKIEAIFELGDVDGDGQIDMGEFVGENSLMFGIENNPLYIGLMISDDKSADPEEEKKKAETVDKNVAVSKTNFYLIQTIFPP